MLEEAVALKHEEINRRKREKPLASFVDAITPSTKNFAEALKNGRCGFIFECKRQSPSKGLLKADFRPGEIAREYADVATAISVLTDGPFFGGNLSHLREVAEAVMLPVLCKDFVVDEYQVYEARDRGADAILVMMSVLDAAKARTCIRAAESLGMSALTEVRDETELAAALDAGAKIIGINSRNLSTLEIDLSVIESLSALIPPGVAVIAESGVKEHADVIRLMPHANAFLVGSAAMAAPHIGRAIREIAYGRVKVCGITSQCDAQLAWKSGASWGGIIFAKDSPRKVSVSNAGDIIKGSNLQWAGVFVDEPIHSVIRAAKALTLAAVQLHGSEDAAYITQLKNNLPTGCEVWKALQVSNVLPTFIPGADRILLDTEVAGLRGGTGRCFDWSVLKGFHSKDRLILSGGLNSENVSRADRTGAWMLDVNSGVELQPGRKDESRLMGFFRAILANGRGGIKGESQ